MTKNIYLKTLIYTGIFVLGVVVLYLGCEAGYRTKYWLEQRRESKNMENFNKEIEKMFQDDTFGGATPEETFNMFVQALKDENVDSAVKYFILDPDRRAKYQKQFDDLKTEGKLKGYGEEWPKWEEFKQIKDEDNDWENQATVEHTYYRSEAVTVDLPNGSGGYIKHTFQPGNYVDYSPVFIKNTNNIWKIESL